MAEKIRLSQISDLAALQAAIRRKGFPCNVAITGAGRSLPQNALFHKWCEEIAQFFVRMGKTTFATGAPMNMENVKRNLKQTFLGEEVVRDINLKTGEVTERHELRHTSQLDKGAMHAFMTCVDKWATEHGIYLPHPEDSEYMRMQREFGEAA
ncbi:recombination protein NinB [Pseudomonas sp. JS3066]|uniref:recombination protein NinB n=1 Tax=Pseudomonas sp. JS3066 TaxID=3090665 RepID=UPI002E7B884D|nr:recombination protein NinB [Pseudomonas sp. JS3066]WVK90914.1 recombination protein NinB [Pseudomonas sp. JS3066]